MLEYTKALSYLSQIKDKEVRLFLISQFKMLKKKEYTQKIEQEIMDVKGELAKEKTKNKKMIKLLGDTYERMQTL